MKILETSKFRKLRKRIGGEVERSALKNALAEIEKDPNTGKRLKGEFALLRSFPYTVEVQPRRLIYRWEKDVIILFSFGLREGLYK